METNILSISPQGYVIYFSLFSLIVLGISGIIFLLLSSNSYRREQFLSLGTLSKETSLIIVLPLVLFSIYYFYDDGWGCFYTLDTNTEAINIGYRFPTRTIKIGRDEKIIIYTSRHIRKGGSKYRLIIKNSGDGKEYRSQLLDRSKSIDVISKLERALDLKVKT